MAKTERKDGYYWVKNWSEKNYEVAFWSNYYRSWVGFDTVGRTTDSYWDDIGPRIPEYKPKKRNGKISSN